MAAVRVLRKAVMPVVWVLTYLVSGLSVFGRGLHVSRRLDDDADVAPPAGAHGRVTPRLTAPGPEPASPTALSLDERLWAAELDAADDAGAP